MSLLDQAFEDVLLYPEVTRTSRDGNLMTQPSDTPIEIKAKFWSAASSGTSARRSEQDNGGFESEQNYKMHIPDRYGIETIGAQARIEWRGQYWSIVGEPNMFIGSKRTAHKTYIVSRN